MDRASQGQGAVRLVDLDGVLAEIGEELEAAVLRVCRSGRYVGGAEVERFEADYAEYLGVRHVVGVASGTDALELSFRALGIGAGDEVIVPANTFIATAEAVAATGARAVFTDVHLDSGLIDLTDTATRVTAATRAVVPVHLYGRVADMTAVKRFADDHGLAIVEDAAQAHGARRAGYAAGTAGDAGCFSFYASKNLGALGEAGAVVTDDDELASRLRLLRDHGRAEHDLHVTIGRNSRLDPIQAAALSVKLPHLDGWNEARRRAAARLRERLPPALLDWRAGEEDAEVHHLFPVLADDRDGLATRLAAQGIQTGVHYRHAIPDMPSFRAVQHGCLNAVERARRQLSLPMHPYLTAQDLDRVATAVRDCLEPYP